MSDALADMLGVEMAQTFTVSVEGLADQRVEADDWRVVGDFVCFGSQLTTNSPNIAMAVPRGKVLLIRKESS